MLICPHCKNEYKYRAIVCPKCGKEIPPDRRKSTGSISSARSEPSTPIWLIQKSDVLKNLVESHQSYSTPTHVFFRRIVATMIDHIFVSVLTGSMIGSAYILTNTHPDFHDGWVLSGIVITFFFVHFFYTCLFLLFSPGTPGYYSMRLAITTDFFTTLGLPFSLVIQRWFFSILFSLLFGLTFIWALFRSDGLFLHDVLTNVRILELDEFHILFDIHLKE